MDTAAGHLGAITAAGQFSTGFARYDAAATPTPIVSAAVGGASSSSSSGISNISSELFLTHSSSAVTHLSAVPPVPSIAARTSVVRTGAIPPPLAVIVSGGGSGEDEGEDAAHPGGGSEEPPSNTAASTSDMREPESNGGMMEEEEGTVSAALLVQYTPALVFSVLTGMETWGYDINAACDTLRLGGRLDSYSHSGDDQRQYVYDRDGNGAAATPAPIPSSVSIGTAVAGKAASSSSSNSPTPARLYYAASIHSAHAPMAVLAAAVQAACASPLPSAHLAPHRAGNTGHASASSTSTRGLGGSGDGEEGIGAAALSSSSSSAALLTLLSISALEQLGIVDDLALPRPVLLSFFSGVASGYGDQPYHSALHAADVTQAMFFLLTGGGLGGIMGSPEHRLAAILRCVSIEGYSLE